jgi:hypothetical protein
MPCLYAQLWTGWTDFEDFLEAPLESLCDTTVSHGEDYKIFVFFFWIFFSKIGRRLGGVYYLHHQVDVDGGSKHLWKRP